MKNDSSLYPKDTLLFRTNLKFYLGCCYHRFDLKFLESAHALLQR